MTLAKDDLVRVEGLIGKCMAKAAYTDRFFDNSSLGELYRDAAGGLDQLLRSYRATIPAQPAPPAHNPTAVDEAVGRDWEAEYDTARADRDTWMSRAEEAEEAVTTLQAAVHERVAEREALKAEVARLREGLGNIENGVFSLHGAQAVAHLLLNPKPAGGEG